MPYTSQIPPHIFGSSNAEALTSGREEGRKEVEGGLGVNSIRAI